MPRMFSSYVDLVGLGMTASQVQPPVSSCGCPGTSAYITSLAKSELFLLMLIWWVWVWWHLRSSHQSRPRICVLSACGRTLLLRILHERSRRSPWICYCCSHWDV